MIETALRHELVQSIPELENKIYPTNAPENAKKPYLVYMRTNTRKIKTFEGYTNYQILSFMFNIMAKKYRDMDTLRDKVEDVLFSLPKRYIGSDNSIYIQDIDINNITEQYEHELKVNRGIIDFTIYFEEVE